ncbi:phosphoglycerate mutase-like protein [Mycena haematopus]|nr:phosphoglycerate mutase-like protein [Mycena haematopus]
MSKSILFNTTGSLYRQKLHLSFKALAGFFVQDDLLADAAVIGAVPPRFGHLDTSPARWSDLLAKLRALNAAGASTGTAYKLFFFGRHGQGYHNVAEDKYGTQAWDDYWSKLDGDGEITWGPDPELTPLGLAQAAAANTMWKDELRDAQIPHPDTFLCSPLTRAMQTAVATFGGVFDNPRNCREEHGVHTCDKRSTRTQLETAFSEDKYKSLHFELKPNFAETDLIWLPDVRETHAQVAERAREVLDRIFAQDGDQLFISITAHSGTINGFLHAMGRARYMLPTGGACKFFLFSSVERP